MTNQLLYTPDLIHLADSTMCESDSFYLLTHYKESFPLNIEYTAADYSLSQVLSFSKIFSTFHARVNLGKSSSAAIPSSVPIDVFRYKMLQDGSWYYLDTLPSSYKDGYIVEGAIWSNGMYYIVKTQNPTEIIDAYFSIDQYTKGLYNYP